MATKQDTAKALCGADKRSGDGTCTRPAGWGTDHPGTGHCKFHGGSTPNGIMFAARAEVAALGMHSQIDVEPHEALLTCVRIAAGHVSYSTQMVEQLRHEDYLGHPEERTEKTFYNDDGDQVTYEEKRHREINLHAWIKVQKDSINDLARFSKMAIDAGVEERRVQLAERWGDRLAMLLQGVLSDVRLTDKQRALAQESIPRRLAALEVGGVEKV